MMRTAVALTILVLLAGCSAHVSSFSAVHDGVKLAAHDGEEVNLCLRTGETIEYSWTSTGPLHFNIHSHSGHEVTEWVKEDGKTGAGRFTATQAGVYSPYWDNQGAAAVTLNYAVESSGSESKPGLACPG